jgi:hypothetical protein
MKNILKNIIAVFLLAITIASCEKPSLNPVVPLEAGVYGQGKQLSGSFISGNDAASTVNMQLKWIDVNKKLTMSKQELFVTYYQDYIDKNGNPATATHGTKSLKVMDCKGNNEASTFSITANEVYTLFASAQFDYGTGKVAVFGASRPAGKRFTPADYFMLTWAFTGSNGLVYKWWSVSVVNQETYSSQPAIRGNTEVYWGVN